MLRVSVVVSVRGQAAGLQGQDGQRDQVRHQGHQVLQARGAECGEVHTEGKQAYVDSDVRFSVLINSC
jgi:hypothetical protein